MLVRRHRFHGYGSLNRVYSKGSSVRGSLISLRYQKRDPQKPYRAAVVVSGKVSKSAVKRNRIRRRIFEVIRSIEGDIKPGLDLVFTVYSDSVAELKHDQLASQVKELIEQANQGSD